MAASRASAPDLEFTEEIASPETELPLPNPESKPEKARKQRSSKTSGALVAMLVVCMIAGGLYAGWTTQPAFRAMLEPQVEKIVALSKLAVPKQQPGRVAQPAPKPAAPPVATLQLQPQAQSPTSQVAGTSGSGAPSNAAEVGKIAADASQKAVPSALTATEKPVATLQEPSKATGVTAEPEQPWEKETTILSSKGAEKRLAHQVPPTLARDAHGKASEGTVVLKTLVNEDGAVTAVRLVEGDPVLAAAAVQAVKQWRYKPFLRDGNRVPFQTIVILDF